MNTAAKNEDFITVCRNLKFSQKIIFSDEGNLNSASDIRAMAQEKRAVAKPQALWYSFGASWILYLTNMYKDHGETWEKKRLAGYTHVYKAHLRQKNVLSIKTADQFDNFCLKYGVKGLQGIRWKNVAEDWCGIEIRYQRERDIIPWYNGWDCSSGCVWHPDAVKKIETVAAWEYQWIRK